MMRAGDILRRAAEYVDGPRAVTYGDMAILFENIAILWNAWILASRGVDPRLTAEDVAQMESLLKKARTLSGEGTPDNYIDDCAYGAIAGALREVAAGAGIEPASSDPNSEVLPLNDPAD